MKIENGKILGLKKSPTPAVLPVITGTPTVGQTLTLSNGTWNRNPTSFVYQWYVNSLAVAGANASTYVIQAGDSTKIVTATVTGINSHGQCVAPSQQFSIN